MNRICKIGCLITLAGCLMAQPPAGEPPHGWFGGGSRFSFMGFGPGMNRPVSGAPYSAVQTTQFTQRLADGNTIQHSEQANIYRDNLGRVRVEHNSSGKPAAISIFDPVAGYSYMLQPGSSKAMKSAVRAPRADIGDVPPRGGHRNSSSGAPTQTDNLGVQTINGVLATGTRSTQTIPAGSIGNTQQIQIVREVWISQDLKMPVMIKSSDPRFGETTMQLTNIVQANPDPSLFQVPSGYTVESVPARQGWRKDPNR